MPKVYDPKTPEIEDLFLRMDGSRTGSVYIRACYADGEPIYKGLLLFIDASGVRCPRRPFDPKIAARAGLTNALDANGRLKVIGQEEVEAEEMQAHSYESEDASSHNALTVIARTDGNVVFGMRSEIGFAVAALSPKNLRDLRDHINRHLAYVEKEGLE